MGTGQGTTTQEAPAPHRIDSVDFLRGVAMMCLALVHSVLYFTPLNDDVDVIYAFFTYGLGDIGAALFTTLVGVSFVLSMRSRAGLPQSTVVLGATLRGVFLLAVAVLVSAITTGPRTIFEWDVLALIAVASIVIAFLRRLPDWALLVVAGVIVILSPVLREAVDYLQWWGGRLYPIEGLEPPFLMHPPIDYAPGLSPMTAVIGLLVAAWFPLFPWLAFPVIGMVLGRRLMADHPGLSLRWALLGVSSLAVGLSVAYVCARGAFGDPVGDHLSVLSFTPESTTLLLVQLGLVLLVMAGAHAALDSGSPAGKWMDPVRLVSRYALTVYVLSYAAIFAVIHIADLIDRGREHQYALTTSLPALLFGVGFVVVIVPLLRIWDQHGGVGSLEWMMSHLRLKVGADAHTRQGMH